MEKKDKKANHKYNRMKSEIISLNFFLLNRIFVLFYNILYYPFIMMFEDDEIELKEKKII